MWDSIAYKQYGSTSYTGALIAANLKYAEYYIFPAGITLALPDLHEKDIAEYLPPWKQVAG